MITSCMTICTVLQYYFICRYKSKLLLACVTLFDIYTAMKI